MLLYNLRKGRIIASKMYMQRILYLAARLAGKTTAKWGMAAAGYAPSLIPNKHLNSLASQGMFFNCLASLACQFIKVFIKCLNIYSQRRNQRGKRGKNPPKRLNDLAIISSNFKICQKIDEVSICEPKFFK